MMSSRSQGLALARPTRPARQGSSRASEAAPEDDRATLAALSVAASAKAGLVFVSPDTEGLSRRRRGRGFSYHHATGERLAAPEELRRIAALAIPPAWTEVWICADPRGYLQAVGRDAKGRRQYRYHADFRADREQAKFAHMTAFAEALPAIRAGIDADLRRPGLPREKVLATVVRLLETTLIRVGNAEYAKDNASYGLTTLLSRHVRVEGGDLRFHFKGKSGKTWRLSLRDRRAARVVKACQELPGQHLFQYVDAQGQRQDVGSGDVNAYLRAISDRDVTAKDFRTWAGTVQAAAALALEADAGVAPRRRLNAAVKAVSQQLGNTPTVCRKHYIHPAVIAAHLDGALALEIEAAEADAALSPIEAAVLRFLQARSA